MPTFANFTTNLAAIWGSARPPTQVLTSKGVVRSIDQQGGLSIAPWTTLGRSKKWTCKTESQKEEVAVSQDVDEVECLDAIQANPSSAHT